MGYRYENGITKIDWPDAPGTTPFTLKPPGAKHTPYPKDNTYHLYDRASGDPTDFRVRFDPSTSEVIVVDREEILVDRRNYADLHRRNYADPHSLERLRELATEDLEIINGQPRFGNDYTIVPVDFEGDGKFDTAFTATTIFQNDLPKRKQSTRIALKDWLGYDAPDGVVRAYPLISSLSNKEPIKEQFGIAVRYGQLRAYATIIDMTTGNPIAENATVVAHATHEYGGGSKSNMASAVTRRGIVRGPDGAPMWSPQLPTTRGRRTVT